MKAFRHAKGSAFFFLGLLLVTGCGSGAGDRDPASGGEWMAGADPNHPYGPLPPGRDVRGEKNFAELINKYQMAKPTRPPWVAYWWPYSANGIANGSQTGGSSPAGKYDAARGYSTSAESWEVAHHGVAVPGLQGWWGHCNGWCAAAALFPEPTQPTRVNGIEFGIADIKALLTEAAMEVSADFYGNRVDWSTDYSSPKMEDTIPAQYFLVLTNYMGKLGQTVLIDRYTGDQVWNQPVAGYRFEYPQPSDYIGATSEAPDVYRILLRSTIWWARDDVPAGSLTMPFEYVTNEHYEERPLVMELWLDGPVEFDESGKIVKSGDVLVSRKDDWLVGGRWSDEGSGGVDSHPDYMWVPFSVMHSEGEDPYANIFVDANWLQSYVVPGVDDVTVREPGAARPAPGGGMRPNPTPSSLPGANPGPAPAPLPSMRPNPVPAPGTLPGGGARSPGSPVWPPADPWPFPGTGGGGGSGSGSGSGNSSGSGTPPPPGPGTGAGGSGTGPGPR